MPSVALILNVTGHDVVSASPYDAGLDDGEARMPIAGQRDPETTRVALTSWLAGQVPEATDVTINDLVVPQASGFSNETFLFTAAWSTRSGREEHELVLRSQPQEYALFPEIDLLTQQYRTMQLLGEHTNVPVPRMRFAEPDPSVLGQPFFVMDRLHGRVPGDRPAYTAAGFVLEMTPAQRARQWRNGIEAMTKVAKVDWRAAGFDYLDKPHHGRLGSEQRRNYFRSFLAWASGGRAQPVADPAWEWLEANWPEDEPLELCWGDARPGNQMYDESGGVVGLFDWEMVAIANAESDLGWWLFLQRFHTDGTGVALPEGIPDRDETATIWAEHMGREPEHLDFYERLAGFHFTLVMLRISAMTRLLSPDSWNPAFETHNPVMALTKQLIGIE